ncbi:MAG TPA: Gfo/Idh/MocA family oxidoreductase [Microthrixaceae bacterium]|nr:Gfo/Idh/MocA family oxidoreductase [Microthrixaceae bacterium]
MTTTQVRIGILGASRIAPLAVIGPSALVDRVEIVAVAARDRGRAEGFAAEHDIRTAHGSYDELLADIDVDAIYNGLPIAAHAPWSIAALRAGKHVLCEKPFACSAAEAEAMVAEAVRADRVLVEAFHWRYHPLADRVAELIRDRIGCVEQFDGAFCVSIPNENDIRHDLALGGGAMMDLGCYMVHIARFMIGGEPEVVSSTAMEGLPGIDLAMEADLRFPSGVVANVRCSMEADVEPELFVRVTGEQGSIEVQNPIHPTRGHLITVTDGAGTSTEQVEGHPTFVYQLEAFAAAVLDGAPVPTGDGDAIATMRVLDACYERAGLPPRCTPAP